MIVGVEGEAAHGAAEGHSRCDKLFGQGHFHRIAVLVQNVESGFRHVTRGALGHGDFLRHEPQAGHL